MSSKKRKRKNNVVNIHDPDELEDLGIYDDDEDSEELDEEESWRYYG